MAKGFSIMRILILFTLLFVVRWAYAESNPQIPTKASNLRQHLIQPGKQGSDAEAGTEKSQVVIKAIEPNKTEVIAAKKSAVSNEEASANGVSLDAIIAIISPILTAIATVVIAWFTVSLASSTKKLWGETQAAGAVAQKSAQAAEKAATAAEHSIQVSREAYIASERPWVSVDAVIGSDLLKNSNGIEFGVNFTVKNHGKSPAINVHIFYDVVTLVIAADPFSDVRQKITSLGTQTKIGEHMGVQLFPSDVKAIPWINTLSNVEIEKALKSHKPLAGMLPSFYIVGSVFYQSAFGGETHQTGFNYYVVAFGDPKYPKGSDVPDFTDTFPMGRIFLDSKPYYKGTID